MTVLKVVTHACTSCRYPVLLTLIEMRLIKFNFTSRAYPTKLSPLEDHARPRALPRPPPYGAVERSEDAPCEDAPCVVPCLAVAGGLRLFFKKTQTEHRTWRGVNRH